MGADIYIFTKKKPDFEGIDPEVIEQVEGSWYFRDPYNDYNLAWTIGLSYWADFEEDPVQFIKRLSEITDEQIEEYARATFVERCKSLWEKEPSEERIQDFIYWAKLRRDYLKRLVRAGIKRVEYSI